MDFSAWLTSFRELHERARRKLHTSEEHALYLEAREQLARTLLAAQGQSPQPGGIARRNFRVPKGMPVDVSFRSGPVRSRTLDISSGGFSCMLGGELHEDEPCAFVLWLPGQEDAPVVGRGRTVALAPSEQGSRRVSFTFTDVNEDDRERLEMMIFDLALGYIRA
ncbi:PilZ domain-containing protein [Vitiosangium sp. GDMCC 1.1324]|uniref:PilZ domain-containing protein n=1 Tax=Vitiosangium sp. (strain GDMCC 1.1324) TaxID=2138576 RepID=UPI000D359152|nr:PilZ domain-containing protein [Vitiosangium sp. GDMCC 1.1324]PTL82417.1 pilus assembly protein PilZ [Vitiosangium sp. GDMCC 1.1324]